MIRFNANATFEWEWDRRGETRLGMIDCPVILAVGELVELVDCGPASGRWIVVDPEIAELRRPNPGEVPS